MPVLQLLSGVLHVNRISREFIYIAMHSGFHVNLCGKVMRTEIRLGGMLIPKEALIMSQVFLRMSNRSMVPT